MSAIAQYRAVASLSVQKEKQLATSKRDLKLMSQSVDERFSDKDYRYSQENQLGKPLSIYKLRMVYICTIRISSLFCFITCIALIIVTLVDSMKWYQDQHDSFLEFLFFGHSHFSSWVSVVVGLVFGLVVWVESLRAQKEHVILCEQGLLQIGKDVRGKDVTVVRWRDVVAIKQTFFGQEFSITHAGGKTVLFSLYKDSDELIAFIRRQNGVA